jgi:hypothetical protein
MTVWRKLSYQHGLEGLSYFSFVSPDSSLVHPSHFLCSTIALLPLSSQTLLSFQSLGIATMLYLVAVFLLLPSHLLNPWVSAEFQIIGSLLYVVPNPDKQGSHP